MVVIVGAVGDQRRRPSHGMYDFAWNSKYISVYTRKYREVKVVGKDRGTNRKKYSGAILTTTNEPRRTQEGASKFARWR